MSKGHDILVYMPPGARRMERFRATTAANEIRDEDHAGEGEVVIIGKSHFCVFHLHKNFFHPPMTRVVKSGYFS